MGYDFQNICEERCIHAPPSGTIMHKGSNSGNSAEVRHAASKSWVKIRAMETVSSRCDGRRDNIVYVGFQVGVVVQMDGGFSL